MSRLSIFEAIPPHIKVLLHNQGFLFHFIITNEGPTSSDKVITTFKFICRIFNDFTFDPSFSTINTPVSHVFEHKRGVCQDYAHLTLTCLRSIGLAARYVSGYIETIPPPGQEKLTGADATHAWVALFVPGSGWIDYDPTNNLKPYDQHVTLAVGRDFADITPLKGIMFGGGNQVLDVSVDMNRGQ